MAARSPYRSRRNRRPRLERVAIANQPRHRIIEAAYGDPGTPQITIILDADVHIDYTPAALTAYGRTFAYVQYPNGTRQALLGILEFAGPEVTFELDGAFVAPGTLVIDHSNIIIADDGIGVLAGETCPVHA